MPRALIVDDSRYQRHLILQALGDRFEADEAADGRQAVELYRAAMSRHTPYVLVVMDILMPELSGHDALAAIRAMERELGIDEEERVPAVMLSSLDDPGNMLRAQFESGAQAYITKPFTPKVLFEALANLGLAENPLADADLENEIPCKAF